MLVNLECVRLLNPWTFNWTCSPKYFSLAWLSGFFIGEHLLQDKYLRRSVITSEVRTMIKLATLFIDKRCYQDYSYLRRSVITSGGVSSPHEVRKMSWILSFSLASQQDYYCLVRMTSNSGGTKNDCTWYNIAQARTWPVSTFYSWLG